MKKITKDYDVVVAGGGNGAENRHIAARYV